MMPALSSAVPRPYNARPLGRLKWWRRPRLDIASRLHIMVRIQQHSRLAWRVQKIAIDVGMYARQLQHLHIFEASGRKQRSGRFRHFWSLLRRGN